MNTEVIPSQSEYEKLLQEVRELQARIVELTALRDDLRYHICPALQAKYEEKIGSLEREILAAKLYLREKQRILEILQAQLNRQEVVSVDDAEETAGEEFREYEEELRRKAREQEEFRKRWNETQWGQYDQDAGSGEQTNGEGTGAGGNGDPEGENGGAEGENGGPEGEGSGYGSGSDGDDGGGTGSGEEGEQNGGRRPRNPVEELKKLYRMIVKRLHPDVHPDLTEREKELFNEATAAYQAGDLDKMRAIWEELESGTDPEERFENKPEDLQKLRELLKTLRARVQVLSGEIAAIGSEFPYTMKDFLENDEAVEEKRAELKKQLQEIRDADAKLAELIEQVRQKVKNPWQN